MGIATYNVPGVGLTCCLEKAAKCDDQESDEASRVGPVLSCKLISDNWAGIVVQLLKLLPVVPASHVDNSCSTSNAPFC